MPCNTCRGINRINKKGSERKYPTLNLYWVTEKVMCLITMRKYENKKHQVHFQ